VESRLRQRILSEATLFGLSVDESFYTRLDAYVQRFFAHSLSREQTIIQAYLGQAALRIAKSEGKSTAQADDVKAAIWMFHLPENLDDPCTVAGIQALKAEQRRARYTRGLLTESFKDFLDQL
jgi:hypothetical protein